MSELLSRVMGVILAFVLACLFPITLAVMADDMADRRSIQNEVSNLIDEVIDTKTLTKDQIEDFYIGVSSYGPLLDVKIHRYVREVNPDPKRPGDTYTTYVITDNTSVWNQGDSIQVTVTTIGYTGAQRFVMNTTGLLMSKFNFTLAGRVR